MKKPFIILILFAAVLAECTRKSPPIEHTPENRLIYFTAIDGDHPIEINMEAGEHTLMVAMDNGELWLKLTKGDKVFLDTDATFSAEYQVRLDESGVYTLTLTGKKASGSVNY